MSKRMTNEHIKLNLTALRNDLRSGEARINFREPQGDRGLRAVVAEYFGLEPTAFNTENFNPQTLIRFANLFDVPVYPTQDEAATALQNFINRRANPWAHLAVSATEADPVASEVQANG